MRNGSGERRGVRALIAWLSARRRLLTTVAAFLLVPMLCVGGILMYLEERNTQNVGAAIGDAAQPDRIELYVIAQQVNAAQQRLQLRVEIIPHGTLAGDGIDVPAKNLSLYTSSRRRPGSTSRPTAPRPRRTST